ncbi:unnamed protein product [Didymodactylos carnosus]|nr:unnamed protein product [Didymodactylos carnosus]CAF3709581.1 unnamed protein product [Didymodactylos carnosus]
MSALEDLSISTYEHVGCLNVKNEYHRIFQQQLSNDSQESSSYQIFSSSIMDVELCFRLCRRWTILIYDKSRCICLYTISEHHEYAKLGDWTLNCTNRYSVYTLGINKSITIRTKFNPLSKISASIYQPFSAYDWSLDGCYYFSEIQSVRVDLKFDTDYEQGLQMCMRKCLIRSGKSGYFFLSRRKNCYCSTSFNDVKIHSSSTTALRKSIKQCSFLTPICFVFKNTMTTSCQQYSDGMSFDTLAKINYKMYCFNNAFGYSRVLHQCIQLISFSSFYRNYKQLCSTTNTFRLDFEQQWTYLLTYYLPVIMDKRIGGKSAIWIDRRSKYAYELLTQREKEKYNYLNEDQCLILYPTFDSWYIKIVPCIYYYAYYGLCQTAAIESNLNLMKEFTSEPQ